MQLCKGCHFLVNHSWLMPLGNPSFYKIIIVRVYSRIIWVNLPTSLANIVKFLIKWFTKTLCTTQAIIEVCTGKIFQIMSRCIDLVILFRGNLIYKEVYKIITNIETQWVQETFPHQWIILRTLFYKEVSGMVRHQSWSV